DNVVPTVSANPAGGTYTSAQSVVLSANESPITIYYTDNGSTPTTSSATYSSAISVSALGTTVLRFFAVDNKGNQSSIVTETYIITSAPAGITLTKTATTSVVPIKVASNDNRQIAAASSLLGEAGGLLAVSLGGQYRDLKLKLIKVNLLLLVISLVLALLILRLPWLKKIPARLSIPRFILFVLLALGLSALASLSVLINVSQISAAATDVNPGNYISYRLDYSNTGGEDAYGVYIVDAIPTYSTYVANTLDLNGKLKTDAADTDTADYNSTNKGKVTFQIGTVTVGSSGYVNFKVKVNDNAPMGAVIVNQGNGAFNPGNVAFQSNTVQNTVVATGLISGFVFYDANNNGTRDSGDFGISGANVKLYNDVDKNGALDTSVDTLAHTKSSASNGSYDFTGLSAGYYLVYVDNLNTSYKLTTGNMPGQAVLATSTQQYTGADFGYYSEPQLPVTPPIVGGKKDDGSDSSTDTVVSRLPVDRVSDYIRDFLPNKTDEEEEEEETEENTKRPDKLEESDDLKRPQEKDITKGVPLIVKEIISWWERFKDANKNYIAPFLFLLTLLNFLLGVPLSILLSYLHYLLQVFTEPLLFFSKKKRQGWGVVYDSLTKQPLDLALVRLFDQKTNKLVETRVTDVAGRFLFIVEPEKSYYLTVDKPYYTFPSRYLEGKKADANYHDLYYGNLISADSDRELKEAGHIAVNVPLDPQEGYVFNQAYPQRPIKTPIRNLRDAATLPAQQIEREDQRILHSAWWRKANQIAAYIGPILGLVSFIISPTWLTFAFLLLHIILLILFNRLALGKSAKPWGKVFSVANKSSLPRSVVRLFDSKYGRLLLTTVSKSDGRYGFLVGQETYSLVPFKDGYKFPPQKIEIIGTKERVVRKDLGMEKSE
ncbi:MAG: chitobiase/beta-hexosaminidase C-terminal domain-containing protein, partial [Parcubacteria group bacterium]